MAIKYYDKYPQRWDSPSQDYPQGAFKNLSALGEQDGSYLEKDWLNDQSGFFGALLRNAEMTPNGLVDTAQKSQFYDALVQIAKKIAIDNKPDLSEYFKKEDIAQEWGDSPDKVLSQKFLTKVVGGTLNASMFGVLEGVRESQSERLNACLMYAKDNGFANVLLNSGKFYFDATIYIPNGVSLVGQGNSSSWRSGIGSTGTPDSVSLLGNKTTLIFYGNGSKTLETDFVTAGFQAGYARENPVRVANNTYDEYFEMLDLTNQDAVGEKKATLKKYSSCVVLGSGDSEDTLPATASNINIITQCDASNPFGLDGYKNRTDYIEWAEWDVGITYNLPWRGVLDNVNVLGYYMLRGLLVLNIAKDDPYKGFSEYLKIDSCILQGGTAIRAGDIYPVVAKTSNTISVPFSKSHTFNTSGILYTSNSGILTYTSLQAIEDTLVFGGIGNTDSVIVGGSNNTVVRTTSNGGVANTIFTRTEFNDFSHNTRIYEVDSNFYGNQASKFRGSLEIGGHPTRASKFQNCSFWGSSAVGFHFSNARDVEFNQSYCEPKSGRMSSGEYSNNVIGAIFLHGSDPSFKYNSNIPSYDTGTVLDLGNMFTSYVNLQPLRNGGGGRWESMGNVFNPRAWFSQRNNIPLVEKEKQFIGNSLETVSIKSRNINGAERLGLSVDSEGNIDLGSPFSRNKTNINTNSVSILNSSGVSEVELSGGFRVLTDSTTYSLGILNGGQTRLRIFKDRNDILLSGSIRSSSNTDTIGLSNSRYRTIYLTEQPSISSDVRFKSSVSNVDTKLFEIFNYLDFKQYIIDGSSKISFGVLAQEWISACDKIGVNPFNYSVLDGSEEDGYSIRYGELQNLFNAYILHKLKS